MAAQPNKQASLLSFFGAKASPPRATIAPSPLASPMPAPSLQSKSHKHASLVTPPTLAAGGPEVHNQNTYPALFKAAAHSQIDTAGVAADKKQARSEPVFDEPVSKKPAGVASSSVQPSIHTNINSSSENSLSTPSSKASATELARTPPTKEFAAKQAATSPVSANASTLRPSQSFLESKKHEIVLLVAVLITRSYVSVIFRSAW
jgi:hypothetical protein